MRHDNDAFGAVSDDDDESVEAETHVYARVYGREVRRRLAVDVSLPAALDVPCLFVGVDRPAFDISSTHSGMSSASADAADLYDDEGDAALERSSHVSVLGMADFDAPLLQMFLEVDPSYLEDDFTWFTAVSASAVSPASVC